jgi:UDP-2,3-diacylglucosamine pyrophosphatase LpxH
MPTLMVGDLHVKHEYILPYVDAAIDRTESDRVVFLGDSCDDWGVTESYMLRALNFFAGWVDEKRDGGVRIDVLLGNHDSATSSAGWARGRSWESQPTYVNCCLIESASSWQPSSTDTSAATQVFARLGATNAWA